MRFVVVQLLELVNGVAIEKAREDGEEVEALAVEIDADGEFEPTAGSGFEGGLHFLVSEFMNVVAEVGIDLNSPSVFDEHLGGLGTKPRPIHRGCGEVGVGKPTAFDRELGRLFFGEREEEAVGGVGGEVGERELGELFDGPKLGGFVALNWRFGARFDEGKFVRAVADDRAGHEPGFALLHLECLQEKLDDTSAGGFFGDFDMEGRFVIGLVFLNRLWSLLDGGWWWGSAASSQQAREGVGAGGA